MLNIYIRNKNVLNGIPYNITQIIQKNKKVSLTLNNGFIFLYANISH